VVAVTRKPVSQERPAQVRQEVALLPVAGFSELVGAIYQGPLEPIPWGTVLGQLRTLLRVNWAILILRPASITHPALLIRDGGHGPEVYSTGYTHFQSFTLDPFVGLPPDQVVTLDEVIEPARWMQGEFCRKFIEPNRIRFILGADIQVEGGIECRLRLTRGPGERNFSAREKALCQLLVPHLKRAVLLHSSMDVIETERQLYSMTMDRMLLGTAVLDERGMIQRTNRVADEILGEKDGLRISQQSLHAEQPAEERELQRLIRAALEVTATGPGVPEALSVTRRSGRASLGVLVRSIPLGPLSEGRHRPAAVAYIRDPERKLHLSQKLIRHLFGLTAAEANLALLLADGLTLDEAARQLKIRKNTIRAHLRSIFAKTGVRRQATLVQQLLSSVASVS